jgi:hypothetical protein
MTEYLTESLKQKFEVRAFKIFFDIKDSLQAETILDTLDKSGNLLSQYFGLTKEPEISIYLYPDPAAFEKGTKKALSMGETMRINYPENAIFLSADRLPQPIDDEIGRSLGYLCFHHEVKEREISMKQYRTPSWLREGICMQISVRIRSDSRAFLLTGWTQLQTAEKEDKLIKPNLMQKYIGMIPDPTRRTLAFFQSFFMVKFLNSIYPEKFFKRYATLMGALDDMDGEAAFGQITGYDPEKFFGLFREWVHTTNLWAAVGD